MAIQAQIYPDNLGLPLCGSSQDWMENGCGFDDFSFNLQQKQLQQQHRRQFLLQFQNPQQQKNQFLAFENSMLFPPSKNHTLNIPTNNNNLLSSISISQSMAAQFEKQRQEIEGYISLQNETLKLVLQEQSKQQLASLLRNLEAKAMTLLRQKDEEIARATTRTIELEDFMRKTEVEKQLWQRVAAENEARISTLNTTLYQLREKAAACCLSSADYAESCCVEGTGEHRGGETTETAALGRAGEGRMVCRNCNSRNSSVLFLPCRHLCSCRACEPFLDACPVCKSSKKSAIEALIS
ncbi:hypothetical protein Nepgr_015370 [Nepenthes gracilis]|uniref:RING-type domain-containing protein n=1 Tax=Nepenthes gracilis TaxID=150966 RepID=A0AAD3XR18_NEPGR|nr:hypothetical protein Nepgr_015370 [Nepenthes gracilis]